jgi:hypothetical protein
VGSAERGGRSGMRHACCYIAIEYVSIRQHTSAYVSIRQGQACGMHAVTSLSKHRYSVYYSVYLLY